LNTPRFLTREEAAAAGRCSREQIDRAIRDGQLEAIKPSPRRVLIPAPAVERWLAARPVVTKAKVKPAATDPEAA
jgi:excisionase family DNA binding protein